jgi:hypothetical protein
MGALHEDLCTFITLSRSPLLITRNVSENFVEKIKANFYAQQIFSKYRPACEQCGKN